MYELIQVAENSFYMDCPAKVGFYKTGPDEVVLIDSGSDKDAGKKVKKILDGQGWSAKVIFNTHSHADHTGGNQYLQAQMGCKIYAPALENCVVEHPIFEPTMLFGGKAMKDMQNKFLMAKESVSEVLTDEVLPEGLEIINLPGHSYDMVGFKTKDNVIYLADCLSSEETLEKYQIGFLYDVKAYIETLEMVKNLEADYFVPSHAPVTDNIADLAQVNIDKTLDIASAITDIVSEAKAFEDILAEVFEKYGLVMNLQQNVLIGSTLKSYLSYLKDEDKIEYFFENNKMIYKAK